MLARRARYFCANTAKPRMRGWGLGYSTTQLDGNLDMDWVSDTRTENCLSPLRPRALSFKTHCLAVRRIRVPEHWHSISGQPIHGFRSGHFPQRKFPQPDGAPIRRGDGEWAPALALSKLRQTVPLSSYVSLPAL